MARRALLHNVEGMTATTPTTHTDPRTAIVTGASRGLGRALAAALAGAGWRVVVDGRTLDPAVADEIPGVVAVPGDVTDSWHRGLLVETALETGRLDLLVNNAG